MTNRQLAEEIANRTNQVYSFERYADWTDCAHAILDLGFSETETEAILLSKWMRWAGDMTLFNWGEVPTDAIVNALKNPIGILGGLKFNLKESLNKLVEVTFA